jgi:hypothetical protein
MPNNTYNPKVTPTQLLAAQARGKQYELTDHLGNIRTYTQH